MPAVLPVAVWFGNTERRLQHGQFKYTLDPNITSVGPTKSFFRWGQIVCVILTVGELGFKDGGCELLIVDRRGHGVWVWD